MAGRVSWAIDAVLKTTRRRLVRFSLNKLFIDSRLIRENKIMLNIIYFSDRNVFHPV
jgi:hypothetical protein